MEQEKEPYLPVLLESKDTKTFPDAHSEFPNVTIEVKEEDEEQEPWVPNQPVCEESKTFPGVHSGFTGAKIKVKEEEELYLLDHVASEENQAFLAAHSGFPVLKPKSIPKPEQGEKSWVQERKVLDENEVPAHNAGLLGVKVKAEEDESWVCDHEDSKKSEPAQASCSGFPVVAVKVEEEEEPWESDHQGYEEGFPGVIIKVEPEEEPWVPDPQTSEESATVSVVQSEETGIPTVPATPLGSRGLLHRPRNPLWSEEELKTFIDIWREEAVQVALAKSYRNVEQFRYISERLKEMGYLRDLEACRSKAKELRRNYKKVKGGNSHSGHPRTSMPFLDVLDQFLCVDNGVVVSRVSGTGTVQQKTRMAALRDTEEEAGGQEEAVLRLAPLNPEQSSSPQPSAPVSDESSQATGDSDNLLLEPSQQTSSEPEMEQERPPMSSAERTQHLRNRPKRQRLGFSRELLQGNQEMSDKLMETLGRLQDRDLAAWEACLERAAASNERALDSMAARLEAVAEQRSQDIRMLVGAVESTQRVMSGFMERQTAVMEASLSKPELPQAEQGKSPWKSHH